MSQTEGLEDNNDHEGGGGGGGGGGGEDDDDDNDDEDDEDDDDNNNDEDDDEYDVIAATKGEPPPTSDLTRSDRLSSRCFKVIPGSANLFPEQQAPLVSTRHSYFRFYIKYFKPCSHSAWLDK